MKVALVYDRVNKWGGAERVLLALHKIWPKAPLYTAVYDKKRATWAKVFEVKPSFLQKFPFAVSFHEIYPWLTPIAFETFSFDSYDLVISVTSAEAKGIITKPHTIHLCYCLTPTRYLWSGYESYRKRPGLGFIDPIATFVFSRIVGTLRRWDMYASRRPDYYIAISNHVKNRIETYYHRPVMAVISPPVDDRFFTQQKGKLPQVSQGYYLVVSRLVRYKRIDILIDAFNILKLPLVVIGDGRDRGFLKKRAGGTIFFVTHHLTDDELVGYYQNCRAFVFAAQEDFGITAVEAQSQGKPVICYRDSALSEIVVNGRTGITYNEQSADSVYRAVGLFQTMNFDENACIQNAQKYTTGRFIEEMKNTIDMIQKKEYDV